MPRAEPSRGESRSDALGPLESICLTCRRLAVDGIASFMARGSLGQSLEQAIVKGGAFPSESAR